MFIKYIEMTFKKKAKRLHREFKFKKNVKVKKCSYK